MITLSVEAVFKRNETTAFTKPLHQFDTGQKLIFSGVILPETYEVQFSNQKEGGISVATTGTEDGVLIPDVFLQTGEYVYVWVYLRNEESYGMTQYSVVIPVTRRPAIVPITVQTKEVEAEVGYYWNEDEQSIEPNFGMGYMLDEETGALVPQIVRKT